MLTGEFEKLQHISGNLEGHAYAGLCACPEKKKQQQPENTLISHLYLTKKLCAIRKWKLRQNGKLSEPWYIPRDLRQKVEDM